jgi:anthranilate synthase component 2
VIDNVDSFTFMLVDYLVTLGAEVAVKRNDAITVGEAVGSGAGGILISPGPGAPEQAGISISLAATCIERRHPLLGVCLGHQSIAMACGSPVERTFPFTARSPTSAMTAPDCSRDCPVPSRQPAIIRWQCPIPAPPLVANAWSEDGTVMAMRHQSAPVHGVQFHPESIASEQGQGDPGRISANLRRHGLTKAISFPTRSPFVPIGGADADRPNSMNC